MIGDLRTAERDNYLATYQSLAASRGGESRDFGPLTAISMGIPHPEYNRLFVFDPPPREAFTAAVNWLAERGNPFWISVPDSVREAVEDVADDRVVGIEQVTPGMVLDTLDEIPQRDAADIQAVTDPAGLEDFIAVFSTVFDVPPEYLRPDASASNATEDTSRAAFVGYIDGQPVATGSLFCHDGVAGVFAIAVKETYRGRGIGEAMTWEVLRAGRAQGCQIGALQSSEMAIPLYETMGFETVETYHYYESSAVGTGGGPRHDE